VNLTDTTFEHSAFCWPKGLHSSRNQFVSFERRFKVDSIQPMYIYLFADTRYRLFVNEIFVAYGPGRFVTQFPEYDTHHLTPHLIPGENMVRVEVNYYGCSSFQSMPDGQPGFIAAGGNGDGTIDMSTPGLWLATIHHAWDADAPHFSFAQNPAEICDTRQLTRELSAPAEHQLVTLTGKDKPWSPPVRRATTYPDYLQVRPLQVLAAGPLSDCRRWGVQLKGINTFGNTIKEKQQFVSFATWLWSKGKQSVSMDCFWVELELNGSRITISYPKRLGNHGEAQLQLHEGWNFLSGNIEILENYWPLLLGLPPKSELNLLALPNHSCGAAFSISPTLSGRFLLPCPTLPANFELPDKWRIAENDLSKVTPARLVAWDTPDQQFVTREIPIISLDQVARQTGHAALWAFDFGDEFYGHPVIDVEAPAGTILDVAYDDWKRSDGCVNLYESNPFTDAADRFVLKGGRQRIEALNPRGGYYLQILLRAPLSEYAEFVVHDVAVRRRTTLHDGPGEFECDNELMNWIWRTSTHTLQASTDEAYADCPWRERGSYIGDSLVNFHLNRLITTDLSPAKRTFDMFGKAQRPDGLLPGCAPSWLREAHEDFALIWVQAIRDYWAYTGDVDFVSDQWPVIQRLLKSKSWKADTDGLWDSTGLRNFVDWGAEQTDREGAGNAAINIFRVAALRAASELSFAIKLFDQADLYLREADTVTKAIIGKLWNSKAGRFDSHIGADTNAIHANILAVRYGIGPSDQILDYLSPLLSANFEKGISGARASGYAELYFFIYLLPALADHGRAELAEDLIREHYGFIQALGRPTLPETIRCVETLEGSFCHSWSGAPAIYATEYVLGLRQTTPGNPNAYLLAPVVSGYLNAKGTLPHRNGNIIVSWKRQGSRIAADVSIPRGVTLKPASNVVITTHEAN
jgi:hypothetical protein